MFDNSFQNNSSCEYAEQAVSLLYGEVDAAEKTAFTAHLQSCSSCAEEFAGFNAVHSSVVEWRDLEFSSLELPSIEISYKNTESYGNEKAISMISPSWFAEFRRLFSPFSAAATLAVVLICFGVTFFAVKFSNSREIANLENKNTASILGVPSADHETAANKAKTEENKAVETASRESLKPSISNVENSRELIVVSRAEPRNTIAKVAEISSKPVKSSNSETAFYRTKSTNGGKNQSQFAQAKKLPKLNSLTDDDEDKSLRLAELFEDDGR